LNVTIVGPKSAGYATVFPCGQPAPNASNLNYVAGQTVANAVITPLAAGHVCVYTNAAAHVVVDVTGTISGGFTGLAAPARLLDTRRGQKTVDGQNAGAGALAANTPLTLTVAGRAALPTGTSVVALNVTVVNPQTDGYATVYPCGQPVPNASNVNFAAGQTVANSVVTALGAGSVCVYANAKADVVVDVTGRF
jgi:hypothetical protein